jgi:very-short-patch-repair endonuclease
LPKAKQNYLEAEATLKEELTDLAIGFESKFQPIHTKHWRFDFHVVKLRLLIEIEGGPWSGGRGGKLANKAWSLDRYDKAEDMGFKIERFHPDSILSGYVIDWIKGELERLEDGTSKTISTD